MAAVATKRKASGRTAVGEKSRSRGSGKGGSPVRAYHRTLAKGVLAAIHKAIPEQAEWWGKVSLEDRKLMIESAAEALASQRKVDLVERVT